MTENLPTVIATSVVRGSQKGESHGGIFTVDFESRTVLQRVDWNHSNIDFSGRGADRGLRGITFDGDNIYIAASDELFCYNRNFEIQNSWRNPYLKHCHEIACRDGKVFLTSTGFDSLLAFDLDTQQFVWGFHLLKQQGQWSGFTFNPRAPRGPLPINKYHINMVDVDSGGIYLSGLNTNALLQLNQSMKVQQVCKLPPGTHNSQLFLDGVLFNDTAHDQVRFVGRNSTAKNFAVPRYDSKEFEFSDIDDFEIARQGFGRGLTTYLDRYVIGGSSPSTISLFDLESRIERKVTVASINLTMDVRNAIHGLEIWPYD